MLDTIEETMMMTTRVVICVAMVISLPVQNALAASTYFRYRFKVRLSEKTPLANDPLSGLRKLIEFAYALLVGKMEFETLGHKITWLFAVGFRKEVS